MKVIKINPDLWYSNNEAQAIKHAQNLANLENEMFTVIYGYSKSQNKSFYYIERGTPMIRIGEKLIGEFKPNN